MNAFRIEIQNRVEDPRGAAFSQKIQNSGLPITRVETADIFTIARKFSDSEKIKIGQALTNPVYENFSVDEPDFTREFDWAIEIGFLPGVTDNVGRTVVETIEDLLKVKFDPHAEGVFSSVLLCVSGAGLDLKDAEKIGWMFANPMIQRVAVKSADDFFSAGGMETFVPKVSIQNDHLTADEINLEISDEELIELGKKGIKNSDGTHRGPLALSLLYLHTIRDYFRAEKRNPTDVELESIAQTWSEHCRHTIFANPIDEHAEGIFKKFIRRATEEIRRKKGKKDFCVSVFSDNSGGIVFDENWVVSDKMETHNSPSALDPLGGAMTGIVGVNRDCLGYGRGARPVINRYGFCTGDPRKKIELFRGKKKSNPALQPREILDGVVAGINEGGNQSGIPSPQGFTFFDDRYAGKPLVFAGTIGLIPRKLDGRDSSEKSAVAGDKIIVAGGRVGVDGIHGATFSSESLDEGSPATAVQIGDPITQKKLSDAVIRELREGGFINSVHDCGAGGISGTIGELGDEAGGFEVFLDRVPLKYPNLAPWQIWISESQERMTFSVPAEKADEFVQILKKRGVESTIVGEFTDSGRGCIFFKNQKVFDLDLGFLASGWPRENLKSVPQVSVSEKIKLPEISDFSSEILKMIARPNVASNEWISQQYDHEVLGGSVVKPLQGPGRVNGTASVVRPVLDSKKAVVLSQSLGARATESDAFSAAAGAIDDCVAAAVAVGADVDSLAIMDNFCWCSSDEPERLGQLLAAAHACFETATIFGTPFISGKDSMFNDFKGFDADDNPVKISVPPTLLISALGVISDAARTQTLDFKFAGDKIFLIGDTFSEFGGSEFSAAHKLSKSVVPKISAEKSLARFRKIFAAHGENLFTSIAHVGIGGLAAAISKSCIAGEIGAHVDFSNLADDLRIALFSESKTRFLVSIAPDRETEFQKMFSDAKLLGEVSGTDLVIAGVDPISISKLTENYRGTFLEF
ncbi:phosphoribosylformylglycinamidine synthase [bacterium]|nr:phosphoribosylformylglycinamidine synthase [bacterium]MBT6832395.1 phosphoribosylformylglycinamidine synthase [bacterium]MBT6995940.1 phosphoribosylformylglycinamidine synthase [bacterium]MBT7772801.1 phosphoribosylformylglycinamidine synthase [bacterium]